MQNVSTIASRFGNCDVDRLDQYGLMKGNLSLNADGLDTGSVVSRHRSPWGSTKVESQNVPRNVDEQQLVVNDHRLEDLHLRTHGNLSHSCYHRNDGNFNRQMYDQHQAQQLNTNLDFNCPKLSSQHPQHFCNWGSTKVELRNAPINKNVCDDEYGHMHDQTDQPQVFLRRPEHARDRKNMGAPNHRNIGQSYDQQRICTDDIRPYNDQQKNFFNDNRAPTRRDIDNQDCLNEHHGVLRSQQTDFANQHFDLPTNIPQARNDNNDIMEKLMSRQILGKDLPEFHGEISKWLSFFDHYNDTTTSCKFTDRENTMRLRKCLKGKATDCVESLLVSSTDLKRIIELLERRFGRLDDIVKAEIKKVKEIPSPKENDPQSIIAFATGVQNLVVTLETLKKSNHLMNPILLDEIQDKLPPTLSLLWSEFIIDRKEDLTLRVLADWLERRAEAASRRTTLNVYNAESTSKPKCKARVNTINASSDTFISKSCNSCYGTCQSLEQCEAFSKLDVHKRWDIAKKNKLCFYCLSTNHEFKDCTKKVECKIKGCKRFHHKLLHTQPKKVGIIKANVNSHITKLRIVPVILYGKSTEIKTFALLDPGSTSTLMSEHLSNSLELDGPNCPLLLEWMNGDMAVENDSKIVDTRIQGTQDGAKIYDLFNVRTVKNLPLHKQTINKAALIKQWPYLRTVDFEGYDNAQPELIIGETNGLLTATRQLVHDKWNMPIASKTWLGWVISGNEGKAIDISTVKIFTAHEVETDRLHELVKSSFNLDEAGVSSQKLSRSKEDERAIKLLEKYSTIKDNRWETGLLWRDEHVVLPESRKNALLRLFILEKKIGQKPTTPSTIQ